MLKKLLLIVLFFGACTISAQSTIKTMFYNILQFPEAQQGDNRELILRDIIEAYQPDIFMVCELQSAVGATEILDNSLNVNGNQYSAVPFVSNQSGSGDLQQLLFYRSNMFTLENTDIITTFVRDINRYVLKLNTANGQSDPVLLDIYVTHLKSSQGGDNVALRLDMVNEFTSTLPDLDPNSYIIFAGDLNIYTSTEPAYIELLDPTNAITLVDPIDRPGAWNNNINFQDVHTQSTRTSSGPFGAGAGGGLDDRFDFILVSENMLSDPKMKYVKNSYKAYGNNGNCFNESINDVGCSGEFSQELRDDLYVMSDHLPVVMELETNEEIVILSGTEFEANRVKVEMENTMVEDNLRLIFPSNYEKGFDLVVYNTLGQELSRTRILPGVESQTIDVSALSSGVYTLTNTAWPSNPVKFLKK
ncbi:MAG: hypothetical protein HKN48_10410 [Flavobacteriaceae bacterium]|nr:hypothetical protein [Flavobacteriaceae bacterium]